MTDQNSKYYMTISLNVLNHMGLNLYSNTPAVLAEVIANSWDADATKVDVDFDMTEKTVTWPLESSSSLPNESVGQWEEKVSASYPFSPSRTEYGSTPALKAAPPNRS